MYTYYKLQVIKGYPFSEVESVMDYTLVVVPQLSSLLCTSMQISVNPGSVSSLLGEMRLKSLYPWVKQT